MLASVYYVTSLFIYFHKKLLLCCTAHFIRRLQTVQGAVPAVAGPFLYGADHLVTATFVQEHWSARIKSCLAKTFLSLKGAISLKDFLFGAILTEFFLRDKIELATCLIWYVTYHIKQVIITIQPY